MKRFRYDFDKIREALEREKVEKRLTEQMLAEEIGITQSLMSMFMRGKRKSIGRETLFKICQYFKVPHEHWVKEVPVPEEQEIVKQLELLLATDEIKPEKKGILDLIKNQIKDLYKDIK